MAHHAYFFAGESEQGIAQAQQFAHREQAAQQEATGHSTPEITVLRYGLFSVEDARLLGDRAYRTTSTGASSVLIISITRIFHEAQNALLKLFEEPPAGVSLILVVPSEGMLLPTLRSRLMPLPSEAAGTKGEGRGANMPEIAEQFLASDIPAREKMIEKLLSQSKSDKEEEKQRARGDAVLLCEGLTRELYRIYRATEVNGEHMALRAHLEDLVRFAPILHERSAPLKLIFEHLQLVLRDIPTNPR